MTLQPSWNLHNLRCNLSPNNTLQWSVVKTWYPIFFAYCIFTILSVYISGALIKDNEIQLPANEEGSHPCSQLSFSCCERCCWGTLKLKTAPSLRCDVLIAYTNGHLLTINFKGNCFLNAFHENLSFGSKFSMRRGQVSKVPYFHIFKKVLRWKYCCSRTCQMSLR